MVGGSPRDGAAAVGGGVPGGKGEGPVAEPEKAPDLKKIKGDLEKLSEKLAATLRVGSRAEPATEPEQIKFYKATTQHFVDLQRLAGQFAKWEVSYLEKKTAAVAEPSPELHELATAAVAVLEDAIKITNTIRTDVSKLEENFNGNNNRRITYVVDETETEIGINNIQSLQETVNAFATEIAGEIAGYQADRTTYSSLLQEQGDLLNPEIDDVADEAALKGAWSELFAAKPQVGEASDPVEEVAPEISTNFYEEMEDPFKDIVMPSVDLNEFEGIDDQVEDELDPNEGLKQEMIDLGRKELEKVYDDLAPHLIDCLAQGKALGADKGVDKFRAPLDKDPEELISLQKVTTELLEKNGEFKKRIQDLKNDEVQWGTFTQEGIIRAKRNAPVLDLTHVDDEREGVTIVTPTTVGSGTERMEYSVAGAERNADLMRIYLETLELYVDIKQGTKAPEVIQLKINQLRSEEGLPPELAKLIRAVVEPEESAEYLAAPTPGVQTLTPVTVPAVQYAIPSPPPVPPKPAPEPLLPVPLKPLPPLPPVPGEEGTPGKDGKDGKDGAPGEAGPPGKDAKDAKEGAGGKGSLWKFLLGLLGTLITVGGAMIGPLGLMGAITADKGILGLLKSSSKKKESGPEKKPLTPPPAPPPPAPASPAPPPPAPTVRDPTTEHTVAHTVEELKNKLDPTRKGFNDLALLEKGKGKQKPDPTPTPDPASSKKLKRSQSVSF